MSSETQQKIISILCDDICTEIDSASVTTQSSLFDDFKMDSIQIIQLMTQLESEFEMELDDEDMDFEHFATVDSLAKYVDDLRAAG